MEGQGTSPAGGGSSGTCTGYGQDARGWDHHEPLVLNAQDRATLARRSWVGLVRALAAQGFTGLVVVLLAWGIAGVNAAASALIGAAAYFVPNMLFALRLLRGYWAHQPSGGQAFFLGEAFKLLSAGGLVVLAAWRWGDWLVWPAFLLGLLGVMKGYLVLLVLRRLP